MNGQYPHSTPLTRRSVLHTAWAAPVLVAAAASPAFAASGGIPTPSLVTSSGNSFLATVTLDATPFSGTIVLEARSVTTGAWSALQSKAADHYGQATFIVVTDPTLGFDRARIMVTQDGADYYSPDIPYLGTVSVSTSVDWTVDPVLFTIGTFALDGSGTSATAAVQTATSTTGPWSTLASGTSSVSGGLVLPVSRSLIGSATSVRVSATIDGYNTAGSVLPVVLG